VKNNIRELRKKHGMTQEELAANLGVTRQTIIAIENNNYNPSLELAMKIGALFNLHVDEIFTLESKES